MITSSSVSVDTAITSSFPFGFIDLFPQSVSQRPENPIWLDPFINRIKQFLYVQKSEGSVNGVFLSNEMIYKACDLLISITSAGTHPPLISLIDDGSLHFEWENDSHFLTLAITLDPYLDFFYEGENETRQSIGNKEKDISMLKTILNNFTS